MHAGSEINAKDGSEEKKFGSTTQVRDVLDDWDSSGV
jgi:hypothetical protein